MNRRASKLERQDFMTTYRLNSSQFVHSPGVIAWAINGYAFEQDRATILGIIGDTFPTLPVDAVKQFL